MTNSNLAVTYTNTQHNTETRSVADCTR